MFVQLGYFHVLPMRFARRTTRKSVSDPFPDIGQKEGSHLVALTPATVSALLADQELASPP